MWGHHRLLFDIGYQEFIIALTVVFILFGHKLPRIMRDLGRGPPGPRW
jgi:Sec-independent protein translocase protein TatA